jgi:hypothetical protein
MFKVKPAKGQHINWKLFFKFQVWSQYVVAKLIS